jgi:hypothetical protein
LVAAGDDVVAVEDADGIRHELPMSAIQTARTVFHWGPAERDHGPTRAKRQKARAR